MSTIGHPLDPWKGAPNVTMEGMAGVTDPHSDIFFAAIETTRMPMVLTDPNQPDNPIVFANHAFLSMTGYAVDEVRGRNCRFLQGPETDAGTVSQVRDALKDSQEIATEILNYKKDGTSFWNALFISPVMNREGRLVYFFASQLDVSRRRDAEEALRQAQKMEAVGQLTGGIAHDFNNNLLGVILGYMDSLKDQAEMLGNPRMIRHIGAVSDAAQRATALTQQLLAFSRKQKLEGRVVSLNQLINGMGSMVSRTIGDAILFEFKLDPTLWNARLDPSQTEMALLNIVINSRDAMPNGGRITVQTSNIDAIGGEDLYQLTPGRYAMVSITDTGCGMPEAILKRVMDPFFTTKEEGKGTGLGLSMVYGFAKQSGGMVRIYSEVGHGTTVRLYFPATEQSAASTEIGKGNRAMDRGGSERILVVDDRSEVSEMARTILEEVGYSVAVAADGREALGKLCGPDESFDLLFTDLIMPGGINGVSLAREAQRRLPTLKVLLTTGYADNAIERTSAGGAEFETIIKPYRRADLARKIRIILDGPTGVS